MQNFIIKKVKNSIFYLRIIIKSPIRSIHLFLYMLRIYKNPRTVIIKTFFGAKMKIIIPEVVSSYLYVSNHFETEVENALVEYLHKGDVFVDVGAHFGYFSLLAARLVGNTGHVFSFEPTPSTYTILEENCCDYPIITTINNAVFSKNTRLSLQDFGLQHSALNSLYSPRTTKPIQGKKIKVETVSLDSYFANKSIKPDFIKIDAESSDYEILHGMTDIMKKYKPIICIEMNILPIKDVASSDDILNFLASYGYEPYRFEKGKFSLCDLHETELFNILAIPKKR